MLSIKRAFFILVLLVAASGTFAQTWNGLGANDNWQTIANWIGNVAPVNNGTANVIFAGTTRLTPNVDAVYNINSIIFNNTSGAFSIGGSALALGGGGVINNDADMQTINSSINVNATQIWAANFGPLTFNSLMSINASNILTFSAGAGSSIISGGIAGTGSFTQTGGGTLTPGDGSGLDIVQYAASNQSSLPSPTVNSSGVLDLNGFNDSYQNLTINGGSTTIGGGALTVASNLIMTAGSISSTGAGRLVSQGSITTNAAAVSATITGSIDLFRTTPTVTLADRAAA